MLKSAFWAPCKAPGCLLDLRSAVAEDLPNRPRPMKTWFGRGVTYRCVCVCVLCVCVCVYVCVCVVCVCLVHSCFRMLDWDFKAILLVAAVAVAAVRNEYNRFWYMI